MTLGEGTQGVRGEGHLVLADGIHADTLEVVDGGRQAHGLGDGLGAGFELPWQLVRSPAIEADVANHLAAGEEGGHGVEELLAAPEDAYPRGPQHLVAGETKE